MSSFHMPLRADTKVLAAVLISLLLDDLACRVSIAAFSFVLASTHRPARLRTVVSEAEVVFEALPKRS